MELVGDGGADDRADGGGKVVIVGVKFDGRSRELLTWAMVKMSQPGDRIIALHVLDTVTADSPSSFLSFVKTFDAMLGVYEGFCNLKQVYLKLKVCRGASVRKAIAREVNSCGAVTLILGTSKTHHTIRSSVSVAKYCAKKLPKHITVFAVDNGKFVFKREATTAKMDSSQAHQPRAHRDDFILGGCADDSHKHFLRLVHRSPERERKGATALKNLNEESRNRLKKSSLDDTNNDSTPRSPDNFDTLSLEESSSEETVDNSLALVTYSPLQKKSGWSFLSRIIFHRQENQKKSSAKNMSVVRWVLRFKGQKKSAAIIYPNEKQSQVNSDDDCSPCLDGESGAVVPFGSEGVWPCLSPCSGSSNLSKELEGLHDRYSSTCRLFTYWELLSATSNFATANMVGKGGSSYVYRGCLPDGKELAVKILKPSIDVVKEFVLEIDVITSLHHKNIISLFGFCFENNCLLLVYDFLSRGSLEENLHGEKKGLFGWCERYKVAIGVADALDYLHNGQEQPVIHRDVKSSNILLSDDFEPQLCDFGLSSWASNISSHRICTDVAGTFGYLAPEYFMHGRVSDKVDVYAFGVVLLELLSGRKPINSGYKNGQGSLVMWANPILESGKISQLLDPNLESNYDLDQFERMVLAAKLCIRRAPRLRPQIGLVLKLLQGDKEVTNWAKQQIHVSEEADALDGEAFPTNIQSHLNLVLLDIEDDSLSISSPEQSVSIEDYLKGRWSHASSFD